MALTIMAAGMSNCLTYYERQQFESWLKTKQKIRAIARIMRRNHTVLIRELKRNGDGDRKKYRADAAQRMFEKRSHKQHKGKLDKYPELKAYVVEGLKKEWSPDVIAGKLKLTNQEQTISHESIYHYIYHKEGRYEKLYQYLRQAQPKRQKLRSRKKCKLRIPERISIHNRSTDVGERKRYGDWESDSMIFPKQQPILSVQSERKSKLIRMHKAQNKSAKETNNAIAKTVESLPSELFKTMTFDNGTEGTLHTTIRDDWNIDTYFCDPFASWQKGGVENANKLIRQYLPRSTDLSKLTDRDIYDIQEKFNNRPRKCLGYLSANEVIQKVVH